MKVNHSQSRSTWLVLPLSLLTFVGLLSSLSSHFQPLRASYILPQHTSIPVQIEQIPLEKQVEFVQQDKFWNMGQQGDDAWAGTIPANGGFLRFRLDNGTAHFSGVTMFHQLHCLQILRSTLVALELGKPASHDHNPHSADHSVDPQLHWVHCLDYLRQGITCFADSTTEPAIGDGTEPIVNGWHVEHQCRDPEGIYQMVAEHMK